MHSIALKSKTEKLARSLAPRRSASRASGTKEEQNVTRNVNAETELIPQMFCWTGEMIIHSDMWKLGSLAATLGAKKRVLKSRYETDTRKKSYARDTMLIWGVKKKE